MKNEQTIRYGMAGASWLIAVVTLLGWAVPMVQAQEVLIRYRPLSTQEIKDYNLPADAQKSGGAPNAGLGMPVYMEALVETGTVVTAVNWTLLSAPPNSAAVIEPSPITLDVPAADGGDREEHVVVGRAMLRPDVVSYWDFGASNIVDYLVQTDVVTDNGTLSVTNSAYGGTYLGRDHYLCKLCHADKQDGFNMTAHANAFIPQISGEGSSHFQAFCIECHTVGYDANPLAVNGGFDDVANEIGWTFPETLTATNWTQMDPKLQNVASVQCESCHGVAYTHMTALGANPETGIARAIDVSLSAGTCGQCHDNLTHHVKGVEFRESGHANGHYAFAYIGRSPCQSCHNGAGFVMAHDPDYADKDISPMGVTGLEGVTCATCHDPHEEGDGPHQLRAMDGAPLGNGTVLMDGGQGILCMNCHQSRRDGHSYVADYTGGTFRGPHHGPQADMVAGENAYEYGVEMPRGGTHLRVVEDSCVTCHMQDSHGVEHMAGGHSWKMSYDNGTPDIEADDVHLVENCMPCHGDITDFNFGGEDWDRDGVVEGTQYEIEDLMHQLESLLPQDVDLYEALPSSIATTWSPEQLGGYYNLHFVHEDGSHGVHNPKYAAALLQTSIDALTGGIDVDNDGLLDWWEMQEFGDLTSEAGDGDADNDGVLNKTEMQVGTNPMLADSDNDGFDDLTELQAGTDPLDVDSTPLANNVVQMLPAMELGYVPEAMGVTQQWQSVDLLGDGQDWTDVGMPFVSGHGLAYQLISLRDSTTKVYRVVEP